MKTEVFLNRIISKCCAVPEVEGNKFGLELELEGNNVALRDVATRGWQRTMDGSLRGESVEFITGGPKTFDETQKLVTALFKKFEEHKVKFNDSIRTSTHVHLNFSDKPVKQVFNFFALFTLVEEMLQHYSGEDRKGNLFCISAREGEAILRIIYDVMEKGDLRTFAGDRYKYSACNLSTLYKFGTVEVRTMRGANSAEQVNKWVSILNDLYEYSGKMRSPAELIRELSELGAEMLMRKVFSRENFGELMKTFPKPQDLPLSLMNGARLLQVFAFEFEDAFIKKVEPQKPGEGTLPSIIDKPDSPNFGLTYRVYRYQGGGWNCYHPDSRGIAVPGDGLVWHDGDACLDDHHVIWRGDINRFVELTRNGEEIPLNWCTHHEIDDEGPPAMQIRRGRGLDMMDEDEDVEEVEMDWDEDRDDEDEE